MLNYWNNKRYISDIKNESYKDCSSIMNDLLKENDSIENHIGVEVLGPMLFGFCKYIHKIKKEYDIENLFFLSRDGFIIKKAYELMYPEDKQSISILYVSRLSVILPLLATANNYDEVIKIALPLLRDSSVGYLAKLCDIDNECFESFIEKISLKKETRVNDIDSKQKECIYSFIMEKCKEKFSSLYNTFNEYLKQEKFYGNIGIVDIGWNATIQHGLSKYISEQDDVKGIYLGTRYFFKYTKNQKDSMLSYLFSPGINEEFSTMERFTAECFDVLFAYPYEGTNIGHICENGVIKPLADVSEYGDYSVHFIEKFQKATLLFIQEICNRGLKDSIEITPEMIMNVYYSFAVTPSLKTLKPFDKIIIKDGAIEKKLVSMHSLLYYIIHPTILKRDFRNNVCKIWFLTWLFKIPLPYFKLLKLLAKRGVKSEMQLLAENVE